MNEQSFGIIPLQKADSRWKVLLIQHKGKWWGFPKGHPEENEIPHETAKRELLEETGLTVKDFIEADPLSDSYTFISKGTKINKTVTYFIATVEGSVVIQEEELLDSKWVFLEEAAFHMTFPSSITLCHETIKRISKQSCEKTS